MQGVKMLVLSVIVLAVAGCVMCEDCGTVHEHQDITRIFTSYEILPDHDYYFNGSLVDPVAILAVNKSYTLQGKFWTPVDLSREQLVRWVEDGKNRTAGNGGIARYHGGYQGAAIYDLQGIQVGIWYSRYDWGTFRFPGNNIIIAYPPSISPASGGGSLSKRFDK